MYVLQQRRALVRATLVAAAALFIGGCADQVTAPAPRSVIRPEAAAHDDNPPTTPCATGWQEIEGVWVCA